MSILVTPETERMVRAYVAALSRDPGAVDDLSQEVFVRAIERIDRLQSPDKAGAFLRGIARHVVQEHFRGKTRDNNFLDITIHALSDEGDSVWRAASDRETLIKLSMLIEELPVVARRMFEMRYHDGCSSNEIAQTFGISPGAVRITLMRTRDRLRQRLEDD